MGQTRRGSIEKFDYINDIVVISTDNKRYTKVDEYEAFLAEEESTGRIEYKERLIDYDNSYDPYLD